MSQTVEATQEVCQVRSEGSDTQVHVSQHHVAQLLKKGPPTPMVRQDTRMQHLRRGQHETRQCLLDRAAFCTRGITIVHSYTEAVFWRQRRIPGSKSTTLGECMRFVGKDVQVMT